MMYSIYYLATSDAVPRSNIHFDDAGVARRQPATADWRRSQRLQRTFRRCRNRSHPVVSTLIARSQLIKLSKIAVMAQSMRCDAFPDTPCSD
jgi:hypothetical protein